jgi:hypothetical protein
VGGCVRTYGDATRAKKRGCSRACCKVRTSVMSIERITVPRRAQLGPCQQGSSAGSNKYDSSSMKVHRVPGIVCVCKHKGAEREHYVQA